LAGLLSVIVAMTGPWWSLVDDECQVNHDGGGERVLGTALSMLAAMCLVGLGMLAPAVLRFKNVVIYQLHEAPNEFYACMDLVIEDAYRRYREELGQRRLKQWLENKLNRDVASLILGYLPNPLPGV
jgi:hypothetical protein